jgi:hypothetical protein
MSKPALSPSPSPASGGGVRGSAGEGASSNIIIPYQFGAGVAGAAGGVGAGVAAVPLQLP